MPSLTTYLIQTNPPRYLPLPPLFHLLRKTYHYQKVVLSVYSWVVCLPHGTSALRECDLDCLVTAVISAPRTASGPQQVFHIYLPNELRLMHHNLLSNFYVELQVMLITVIIFAFFWGIGARDDTCLSIPVNAIIISETDLMSQEMYHWGEYKQLDTKSSVL